MKKLIIMRGLPGSGKSTWIKDRGYENCAISMDELRIMMHEPNPHICQSFNREVYQMFKNILHNRLRCGSFTVIDCVNQTWSGVRDYLELAAEFGYTVTLADFSDVPVEDCIERRSDITDFKYVPEDIIRRMSIQMKASEQYFKHIERSF